MYITKFYVLLKSLASSFCLLFIERENLILNTNYSLTVWQVHQHSQQESCGLQYVYSKSGSLPWTPDERGSGVYG